jgi:hypothetical protein
VSPPKCALTGIETKGSEQVARTARHCEWRVRVFCLAIIPTVSYSIAVSKLRRPFLSDRYLLIAVRLLRRREKLTEPDFALLARAGSLLPSDHPHRVVFYRGVETPAPLSFRSLFLYRRAPA